MRRVILLLGVLTGCATGAERMNLDRPPSSAELGMGYDDAVALSSDYVAHQGYPDAEFLAAERVAPNIWCVRFGLSPRGSQHRLDVYFDGQRRVLVRKQEIHGLSASWIPQGG